MTVYIDITEFINCPIRSGVQRVVRALLSNWPNEVESQPVVFHRDTRRLYKVPLRALDFAVELARQDFGTDSEVQNELNFLGAFRQDRPVYFSDSDSVLIPEVFYDPPRVEFYKSIIITSSVLPHFIVYDFVPWLRPDVVRLEVGAGSAIMPYLQLIQIAEKRAFISSAVRDDFAYRVLRSSKPNRMGHVVPLGADGIGGRRQEFDPTKTVVACIGTLDGKKNQHLLFEAFTSLVDIPNLQLVFLGKAPAAPAPWLRSLLLSTSERVKIIDNPTDEQIFQTLTTARATAFISTNEGFGLPAIESLYLGIPVIVHKSLPAISNLPNVGQIRLESNDHTHLQEALRHIDSNQKLEQLFVLLQMHLLIHHLIVIYFPSHLLLSVHLVELIHFLLD